MQRAKKGSGSFTRRGNRVIYRVDYGVDDLTGQRIRKTFTGATETECRKLRKEFDMSVEAQRVSLREITLGDWLKTWLKTYKKPPEVKEATYTSYEETANLIYKHSISNMILTEIKQIHIKNFFNDYAFYSLSVVKKLRILLNGCFESAIDNDLCYKNPARKIQITGKKAKEKVPYSTEEKEIILNFARTDPFGLAVTILARTGMRSEEIRALLWSDINLDNMIITIDKAINRSGQIDQTKNGETIIIPIRSDFAEYLRSCTQDGAYVLGGDTYLTKDAFEHQYKGFFERLEKSRPGKVPYKSPHHFRHTVETELLKAGVDIKIRQALLGHKTIQAAITYSHTDMDMLRETIKNVGL